MAKLKNEVWENLLGYVPDRETKELILLKVQETGQDIRQLIAEGKTVPVMPVVVILNDSGMFEYRGELMTNKKWETVNPLGEFGRIVIIGTQEQVEKHRKNCELWQQI
jgi:hypothetical protein